MIDPVSSTTTSLLPPELLWLVPLAGVVAMLWGHLKTIWGHLTGFVIAEVKVNGVLVYPLLARLKKEGKVLPYNVRRFVVWNMPNRNGAFWQPTLGEVPPLFNRFFWLRHNLILVKSDSKTLSIVYVRWCFDAVGFLETLAKDLRERRDVEIREAKSDVPSRFRVSTLSGRGSIHARAGTPLSTTPHSPGSADNGAPKEIADIDDYLRNPQYDHETRELVLWKGGVSIEDFQTQTEKEDPYASLALPEHFAQVRADLNRWILSAAWYRDRGIPWRRGYLFHGPPGGGKTSLTVALAKEFNLPVYVFDLTSMTNEELHSKWQNILLQTPCIALIEDIHAVFDGRNNLAGDMGGGLTFDCLLNVIGGAQQNNGVCVIITTNEPDKLDPALGRPGEDGASSRPGRLDRAFYFGPPSTDQKRELASKFKLDDVAIERLLSASRADESYAQFSERCIDVALSSYWSDEKKQVIAV